MYTLEQWFSTRASLSFKGHLVMPVDVFGCHIWGGIKWVEIKDDAKCLKIDKTDSDNRGLFNPKCP